MTEQIERSFVTARNFEGRWDALWRGWYTNQQRGEFRLLIDRLGQAPHVTVDLSDQDIAALRAKLGPSFDVEERASVVLTAVLEVKDRDKGDVYSFDMVATRESAFEPIVLQAIGESVRLSVSDKDWAAVPARLGIGRPSVKEGE